MSNASSSSSSLTPPSIRLLASLIFTSPPLPPLFGQRPFFHSPSSTLERDPPFTLFPQKEGGGRANKRGPLHSGGGRRGGALFFRLGAADNCTFPDCLPATVISQRCARWRVAAIHPYTNNRRRGRCKGKGGGGMGPSCQLTFNYTTFAIVPCRKSWPSCPSWGTSARRSSCCRGPVAAVVAAAVVAAAVAAAAGQLRPGAAWDLRHRSRDPRSDICARKGESKLVFRR